MRKVAIFVEGLTEQSLVQRLLDALASNKNLSIEIRRQFKGALQLEIAAAATPAIPDWYVLIANCDNDEQVKTQIIENYHTLSASGYSHIIGIRDVFPFLHSDIPRLRGQLGFGLPRGKTIVDLHLAVMETEAWFLEENTHFSRVDAGLNDASAIACGFDRHAMRAEQLPNPAEVLHTLYQTVGKSYRKKRTHIQRTVNALDMQNLLGHVRQRSSSFDSVLRSVETALLLP